MRRAAVALLTWVTILASTPAFAAQSAATVFIHVNVLPMDRDRVLDNQSVLIEDGTIKAIGPSVTVPAGARVIDGADRFLSPGLADMHVHSDTSRDMLLFLANGVTTVLNMGGASQSFVDQTAPAINAGKKPGPHVYLSLRVDGTPQYGQLVVPSAALARSVVRLAKANGYDFIKVYNNLSPAAFQAFIDEGRREGLPVVGHGVTRVGIERQLAAGQLMVAHLEEYLYTAFFKPDEDVGNRPPRLDQIPPVVAYTKHYRAFVTADLNTYATIAHLWGDPAAARDELNQPDVAYLDPDDRIEWRFEDYSSRKGSLKQRLQFLGRFAKALSDAGVPLLAGTDTPSIPGLVPGFSLHQDLFALEQAGLSRFAALSTATRTPGEFIRRAKPASQCFGVVAVGCRADLILSKGNPLEDLRALDRPDAVIEAGQYYDRAALDGMLEKILEEYREAAATPTLASRR